MDRRAPVVVVVGDVGRVVAAPPAAGPPVGADDRVLGAQTAATPPSGDSGAAGHEPGCVRQQPHDGLGDLVGLAQPAHRRSSAHLLEQLLVAADEAAQHRRAHAARADGVHPDAVAGHLEGGGLREAEDSVLRRRVGGQSGHAHAPGRRGHVHDRPTAGCPHGPQLGPEAEEDPVEVHGHACRASRRSWHRRRRRRRRASRPRWPPGRAARGARTISPTSASTAASCGDVQHLGARSRVEVGGHHGGAPLAQQRDRGRADAGAAACDEGDAPSQVVAAHEMNTSASSVNSTTMPSGSRMRASSGCILATYSGVWMRAMKSR